MINKHIKLISRFSLMLFLISFTSCTDDLNVEVNDQQNTSTEEFYSDESAYLTALAKLYSGFAVSGQGGPGSSDISGIDAGYGQYLRGYWQLQELPTDEAVIAWTDPGLPPLNFGTWSSNNVFVKAFYDRANFQIASVNEFLRQSTDEMLDSRNVSAETRADVQRYRAEARFLRALSMTHLIDMFGDIPFFTEDDPVVGYLPPQIPRAEAFEFIENELLEIEEEMPQVGQVDYPRATQGALWMLLSKLYLNAEVYTGEARYQDALTYTNNVINAGYSLSPEYELLFLADNDRNAGSSEMIFAIAADGIHTQSYGGTTFIIHAAVGGSMPIAPFGINGGWAGLRTTPQLVNMFDPADDRAMFYSDGQSLQIANISQFNQGYAVTKYKNVTSEGVQGSDDTGDFVDTDFPIFRLAEAYLNYAEIAVRGGGASTSEAAGYINLLRERAFGNSSNNISAGDLNLDFILEERARELYWEGHRRTDLIRFGDFTGGSYLWSFKNNVPNGSPLPNYTRLYPIPTSEITTNPNIQQNPGY